MANNTFTAFTLTTAEGYQALISQRQPDDNSFEATIVDRKIPRCLTVPVKFATPLCPGKTRLDPSRVRLVRANGRDVLFVGRLGLLGGGGPGDDPYTCTNCGFVCPNGARYDDCIHHEHGCELAVKIREEHRKKEQRRKAEQEEFARQMVEELKKAEEQKRLQELQRLIEEKEMEEEFERYRNEIRIMI
ncbi:hypothetical protein pipiens_008569 [Culex pipiens pipiens]|uniref:Uncharacterized protein n=1 Tax=Culex pipiens pipiens TaxID=38569 RepID=A0ABD1DGV6_CULPP